jgi:hypothetical protein
MEHAAQNVQAIRKRTSPRRQVPPVRDIDVFLNALVSEHDSWRADWAAVEYCFSTLDPAQGTILPI